MRVIQATRRVRSCAHALRSVPGCGHIAPAIFPAVDPDRRASPAGRHGARPPSTRVAIPRVGANARVINRGCSRSGHSRIVRGQQLERTRLLGPVEFRRERISGQVMGLRLRGILIRHRAERLLARLQGLIGFGRRKIRIGIVAHAASSWGRLGIALGKIADCSFYFFHRSLDASGQTVTARIGQFINRANRRINFNSEKQLVRRDRASYSGRFALRSSETMQNASDGAMPAFVRARCARGLRMTCVMSDGDQK